MTTEPTPATRASLAPQTRRDAYRSVTRLWTTMWGQANALVLGRRRFAIWADLVILTAGASLLFGLVRVGREWTGIHRPAIQIDLSPLALPMYTLYSLVRGLVAYLLSFFFTLGYAFWAAKDRRAERVLVPLLDILQSVPVLGFMPGVVLAFVAVFPRTNIGLELAAVVMIFTGQAWNMTFSLYHSLKSVPGELQETARLYRFGWWRRFWWVELPFGTTALAWNSMMSMAGGWFFLMINESFVLGGHDFRLPGLGSYMSAAAEQGNVPAMLYGVLAMVLMIVGLDQVLWRPVIVWAQRFRVEETSAAETTRSWFLDLLRHSGLRRRVEAWWLRRRRHEARRSRLLPASPAAAASADDSRGVRFLRPAATAALALLAALLLYGSGQLVRLLLSLSAGTWLHLLGAGGATLARVLLSTALGTLWTVPVGLAIGLSPRLSRLLQPVVQVVASFPAPMLFPAVIALLHLLGVGLGWGSVLLMLLGTQWYILFNVIAGAMAIPADLKEAARSYSIGGWQRFVVLYVP
ncbi:MAG TPA: ABC transporter permease subunit, partial [Vicinamibacteria bacterium]|nr:ABC transporter permease subunit [Vicinamibacteria bacterium]